MHNQSIFHNFQIHPIINNSSIIEWNVDITSTIFQIIKYTILIWNTKKNRFQHIKIMNSRNKIRTHVEIAIPDDYIVLSIIAKYDNNGVQH
jgi:hypothetical protein